MISTNDLSVFILHHHLNKLRNKNIRLIQYVMRVSEPAAEKYKRVCEDFPNLAILTKSATPGKIQLTFGHAAVGNKSLGEYVGAFALAGYLSSPSVISLKIEIDFAVDDDKIRLLIAEVLLCAAAGNLAHLNKQRDWTPRNAVLLPPFLTKAVILHRESDAGELLKIYARSIMEWVKEGENTSEADNDKNEDSVITIEAEDKNLAKPGKKNQSTSETLTTITDNCNDVLAFLQAVAVKSPRVIASPLSLRADKHAHVWFRCWTDVNLPAPPKTYPQNHMDLTSLLTNVVDRNRAAEALRPIVAA